MMAGQIDTAAQWRREPTPGIVSNAVTFGMLFSLTGQPDSRAKEMRGRRNTDCERASAAGEFTIESLRWCTGVSGGAIASAGGAWWRQDVRTTVDGLCG
jgi:hypothetical protein